jgi:4-amino-4-deoxy-L-arabinose transferase-like glycosyltransferase
MEQTSLSPDPSQRSALVSIRRSLPWILLGVIWLSIYFQGAFRPPLLDDTDGTHAEVAREMYQSGDYITMKADGVRYLEKPVLPYWLAAMAMTVFGVSEFAVRLPIILAVLALMVLGIRWGYRAFGERGGIYAGLFVLTSVGCYLFSRVFIADLILSLFIAVALYFFLSALEAGGSRQWRWYAGYAALALAVLSKGLDALVFVGFASIGYLIISGEWRRWREFRLVKGIAFFFLIAAPWHILVGLRNHGFFWFYFINEHFLRFLGERYPYDYNKLPALLYWTLHLVWLFPWSLYLPLAFRDLKRDLSNLRGQAKLTFATRTRTLCWVWAGVVLIFFSISVNQEYSTLPAYLPLLLLLAGSLAHEEERPHSSRWTILGNTVYAVAGLAAGAVLVAALWLSRNVPPPADIGKLLVERNVAHDTLALTHFFDLTTSAFAALRLPAALAAIALLIGPLLALVLRVRKRKPAATWAMGIAAAVFLLAAQLAFARFSPYLSSKQLADAIKQQEKPGDMVMIYGNESYGSSLLFYLKGPIYLVGGHLTLLWWGSTFPDVPHVFLTDADLRSDWGGAHRVFLFVPPQQIDKVDQLLPKGKYVVAESSGKVVYSNRP